MSTKIIKYILLLFFLFISSCNNDDSNSNVKKSEHSLNEVNILIEKATKNHQQEFIRKGEFVVYENNYQIEITSPIITSRLESLVDRVKEFSNYFEINLVNKKTLFNHSNNTDEEFIEERKIFIPKKTQQKLYAFNKDINKYLSNFSEEEQSPSQFKIYDLSTKNVELPLPIKVQERSRCKSNKNSCTFNGTLIRFLMEETTSEGETLKFSIDRVYFNNANFLAGTFSGCVSQFFDTEERDYYVKQCTVLRDFGLKEN